MRYVIDASVATKWLLPEADSSSALTVLDAAQRTGLIASGQGKRLAAEGLFVDYKPDIATWMLAPTSDIRSSNALETVQNQCQIQGLELNFCVVLLGRGSSP